MARRAPTDLRRLGFTLIEMLVVIVIVGMLMAIFLGALQKVAEKAKIAKTQATVDKISSVIMAKWESYRTRRVPCDVTRLAIQLYQNNPPKPMDVARVRLNALRELMRLEMPDRLSDVSWNYQANDTSVMLKTSSGQYLLSSADGRPALPAVTRRYQAFLSAGMQSAGNDKAAVASYFDSKCLYMIVMSDPEAASQFREDEISRIDTSNMPVFIDGWGNPIHFLRWPVGFVPDLLGDSDIQTRARNPDGRSFVAPDPFDPMKIALSNGGTEIAGYAIYPLVYSAGPDGREEVSNGVRFTDGTDINVGKSGSSTFAYSLNNNNLDPYDPGSSGYLIGQPMNSKDLSLTPRHYDNIHNHRLER